MPGSGILLAISALNGFWLQLWNSSIGLLKQSIHTHEADVLTLTADLSSGALYAAGVDSKIVQLQHLSPEVGLLHLESKARLIV